jgi:hypothetical protein
MRSSMTMQATPGKGHHREVSRVKDSNVGKEGGGEEVLVDLSREGSKDSSVQGGGSMGHEGTLLRAAPAPM